MTFALAGAGSLTNTTSTATTYNSPVSVTTVTTVTVTATSVKDSSKTSVSTLTISPIAVTLTPGAGGVAINAGQTVALTAAITNDSASAPNGVTWTVTGGGTLASTTGLTNTYTAPASVAAVTTATITATSARDTTRSATTTVTVNPGLAIGISGVPTTGSTTAAYTGTVTSTGGTGTKTYAVASGSLPAGLTLNAATGAITGTPTVAGVSTLTLKVTDSSATPATATSASITLTVTAPALAITTTSLASATINTAYSATVAATGGTPAYTFSVDSGSLPAGLTLAATTGVISGTPTTAATSNFVIKVTDNATPTAATATKSLSITVAAAGASSNNSELNGGYAMLVTGFLNGSTPGAQYNFNSIGQMVFDGAGNISGLQATRQPSGYNNADGFTGTYSIGSDHRGTITLNAQSGTVVYRVVTTGVTGGVASGIKMLRFDNPGTSTATGVSATGIAKLQNLTGITNASLTGRYVFGMQGTTPTAANETVSTGTPHFGTESLVGGLSFNGALAVTTGAWDVAAYGISYPGLATSGGTYGAPSSTTGRSSIILGTAIAAPGSPKTFITYLVSASEMFVMSTDGFLTGSAYQQPFLTFSATGFNGNLIGYEQQGVGGDGTTSPTSSSASIYRISSSGNSNVSFLPLVRSNAGNTAVPTQAQTSPLTIESNGRVTPTTGGPVFWFYGTNKGFATEQPGATQPAGLITLEEQAASFSNTVTGPYSLLTYQPVVNGPMLGGVLTATASFTTLSTDAVAGGALTSGQMSTYSYLASSDGAIPQSGSPKSYYAYQITASRAVMIETTTANTLPSIILLEK